MSFDFGNASKSDALFEVEMKRYRAELKIANLEARIKDARTDEEFNALFNQLREEQRILNMIAPMKMNAIWEAAQEELGRMYGHAGLK